MRIVSWKDAKKIAHYPIQDNHIEGNSKTIWNMVRKKGVLIDMRIENGEVYYVFKLKDKEYSFRSVFME